MNRRTLVVFAIAAVAIVGLWWFLVYSPAGTELDKAQTATDAAQLEQNNLEAQLASLEAIADNGPAVDAELAELSALVPPTSDLAGFILGMNDLAVQSGINWISISPTPPAAEGVGLSTVGLNITLDGGFFQVLDYLNRLEDFDRLVVIDSVNITGGATGESTDGTTSASDTLGVTLVGRMFTTEAPPAAPGTVVEETTTTVAGTPTTTASASTGTTGAPS